MRGTLLILAGTQADTGYDPPPALQSLDPQPATSGRSRMLFEVRALIPLLRVPLVGTLRPLVTIVGCLALLSACAAPPDKYSAEDIQQATTSGNLANLYDQIEADLKDPELGEAQRQTMELRLAESGRSLAQGAEKEVGAAIEGSALPDGLVPLKAYTAQEARLASIKRWDAVTFQRVSTTLSDGEQKTQDAISAKEAELEQLGPEQVEEKLAVFDELGALHGAGTDEQKEYSAMRVKVLGELREEASKAIENEEYSDAQRMLEIVAAVAPKDTTVEGKLVEVDAKLFEQRFYEALAKDRPDDAYQALVTLSASSNFDKVRPRLQDSADVMADYFVTLGAGAVESGNYVNAFRWFSQARDIRERSRVRQACPRRHPSSPRCASATTAPQPRSSTASPGDISTSSPSFSPMLPPCGGSCGRPARR